jgi:uncharacterized protein
VMDHAHESTSVVRALYVAVDQGDDAAIRRTLADDVRWRQAAVAVPAAGEDRVGATAFLVDVVAAIEEQFDGFVETVDDLHACGDRVLATGTYRGVHSRTGRDLTAEFCHLWTVRNGLIAAFRQYTDTEAFAEAARDDGDRR